LEMCFSTTYFCSWFKNLTGITYIQYLNQVRVMQVCRYLNTKIPLKEAIYACGFENMSYFIQLFKKIQGCTPQKYIHSLVTIQSKRE
jgi:AraC-like DNA-binding protein